jgi:hypothetical protein
VRRRGLLLCAIGAAVVGLHIAALVLLGSLWLDPEGPISRAPSMQVRSVLLPPQAPAPSPPAVPVAIQAQRPRAALAPTTPRVAAASAAPASPALAAVAAPEAVREAGAETAPSGAAPAVAVPVYATRLPPPGTWHYRLQRGVVVGHAELRWSRDAAECYELQLQGSVAGVSLLEWSSQGQLDAAGVAPERFAVRGRDRQAANFQRGAGKITFSGPTHELPLLPGAQDRLSWMVQLPAIVAAAPERFGAGAPIVLFVAGARGDADVWTFVVQGIERLGETPVLKLVREPQRLYGVRAEIWLDPAAQYLPLRVVQTPSGGGAALELQRDVEPR